MDLTAISIIVAWGIFFNSLIFLSAFGRKFKQNHIITILLAGLTIFLGITWKLPSAEQIAFKFNETIAFGFQFAVLLGLITTITAVCTRIALILKSRKKTTDKPEPPPKVRMNNVENKQSQSRKKITLREKMIKIKEIIIEEKRKELDVLTKTLLGASNSKLVFINYSSVNNSYIKKIEPLVVMSFPPVSVNGEFDMYIGNKTPKTNYSKFAEIVGILSEVEKCALVVTEDIGAHIKEKLATALFYALPKKRITYECWVSRWLMLGSECNLLKALWISECVLQDLIRAKSIRKFTRSKEWAHEQCRSGDYYINKLRHKSNCNKDFSLNRTTKGDFLLNQHDERFNYDQQALSFCEAPDFDVHDYKLLHENIVLEIFMIGALKLLRKRKLQENV